MNIFTKLIEKIKPSKKEEKIVAKPNGGGIRWNTWDNIIGTKEDIIKYIADNITKDRIPYAVDNMSIDNQLFKIENSKNGEGRLCLFYNTTDDRNVLETIYVKLRNYPL